LQPEHERHWLAYRLWLEKKESWATLMDMSLNQVDLLNLALNSWQEASKPRKKR